LHDCDERHADLRDLDNGQICLPERNRKTGWINWGIVVSKMNASAILATLAERFPKAALAWSTPLARQPASAFQRLIHRLMASPRDPTHAQFGQIDAAGDGYQLVVLRDLLGRAADLSCPKQRSSLSHLQRPETAQYTIQSIQHCVHSTRNIHSICAAMLILCP